MWPWPWQTFLLKTVKSHGECVHIFYSMISCCRRDNGS
ncbi:hypothetical protein BofuT4_uP128480.1 [Botrytis cinerea T4]|uniref:Uncharacterized protein n=1 Tax=Botryotinia fuckeliana (strain T4) TaxID=999810 RepID=G2YRA0_BOTF4|nr:hypothetical protein BofuT4_uP128480.1 [Botrytis cinerea T4]